MPPNLSPGPELPPPLADRTAQLEHARRLAERSLQSKVESAKHSVQQGNWSQTIVLTFDSTIPPIVVQFRIEKLDAKPYIEARKYLGDIVPALEQWHDEVLEKAGIWCYCMSLVEGRTWWEVDEGLSHAQRLASAQSLGAAIARGIVLDEASDGRLPSKDVIENVVRPRFEAVVKSDLEDVVPSRPLLREMLSRLHALWRLPLCVTHNDFRPMNIMLREDGMGVSGLIDWEYSDPLLKPFGFAVYALHYISGRYDKSGVFQHHPDSDAINRAFWQGVTGEATPAVKSLIRDEPELIQLAVRVGTMFDIFAWDENDNDDAVHFHDLAARNVPKFMAWTLPVSTEEM